MAVSSEVRKLASNIRFANNDDAENAQLSTHTLLTIVPTMSEEEKKHVLEYMSASMASHQPEWKQKLASAVITAVRNFA